MRYAVNIKDGGMAIVTTVPIAVQKDGVFYRVAKMKNATLFCEPLKPKKKHKPFTVNISGRDDLWPDSFKGLTLVFPGVQDELKKHEGVDYDLDSLRLISWTDIPTDRSYRDAWQSDGEKIVHNMSRAKAIHRDRIRALRSPVLAGLDVEYQRADEKGDQETKTGIAEVKQKLRDLPADPEIEAASNVDDLHKHWAKMREIFDVDK